MSTPSVTGRGPRARLAEWVVRNTNGAVRRLGRGDGTVAGGRVGLRLSPDLLAHQLSGRDVVLVTGTNGKTTTTALVRAAINRPSASNQTGANMPPGLVAALAESDAEVAVLEVDEKWLDRVMTSAGGARRKVVVLLNLSRDQLDRAGEVRQVSQRWRDVVHSPVGQGWTVVANVNDPLVAYAADGATDVIACAVPVAWTADARSCPRCTRLITRRADTGQWWCECGLRRPEADVVVNGEVRAFGETVAMALSLPGEFNRANAAMALAVAHAFDVPAPTAATAMNAVHSVAGRFEVRAWRGRTWRLMLAKNPAGVAALVDEVRGGHDDLVIAINDEIADGRDPAWIYDAPFDQVAGRRVWCDGTRALDLATRLEYAGVETHLIADDARFPQTLTARDPVDVVANYTAFVSWVRRSQPC